MKGLLQLLVQILFPLMDGLQRLYREEKQRRMHLLVRQASKSVGRDVRFNGDIQLFGAEHLTLGDNVHIGDGAYIRADGGLTIGSHTHISRRITIYTHNHNYKGSRLPYDEDLVCKPVVIGKCVWIGMNVTILPGASIGDGAIIGAGCVIRGEVPALAIVSRDDSQHIISHRDEESFRTLMDQEAFGGVSGQAWKQCK